MSGQKRVPGSIRSEGFATLGVSLLTRNMLKQSAGDMPMSEYLKRIAIRELGGEVGLPGQEAMVSKATIHSVKADTSKIMGILSVVIERLCYSVPPEDRAEFYASIPEDIANSAKWLASKVKARSMPVSDNSQAELIL